MPSVRLPGAWSPAARIPKLTSLQLPGLVLALLGGGVALVLVSIAASHILLTAAVILSAWLVVRHRSLRLPQQSYALPLACFLAWTLLAAAMASNVPVAFTIVRKFFLYLLLVLVPLVANKPGRTTWLFHGIFMTAAFSSAVGLIQFVLYPNRSLTERVSGTMSHWMTYSGLQMLVLVVLVAYAACHGLQRRRWVLPAAGLLTCSLLISLTRSAWAGAIIGIITVLLLVRRFKALLAILALGCVFSVAGPESLRQRLRSSWDPADPNTRNRLELLQTSSRLIRDNPWFGVGPKNVNTEALRYRVTNEWPDWLYQHMHNNFLQIAAESGIPGLLFWCWFMARLAWDALQRLRALGPAPDTRGNGEARTACVAALASWLALLTSGMFEYNFGDSEVLTLFLFIMSTPYAACSPERVGRIGEGGSMPYRIP